MIQLNDVRLETSRLYLIPLDHNQLLMYAKFDGSLESSLGMRFTKSEYTEELQITIERFMVPYIIQHPEHTLFATIWLLVLKDQNVIVGDIGFKGAPSDKGLLEVGYASYSDYRNRGLMTEALNSMTQWAFSHAEVQIILAETDKDNLASQRILSKNRFEPFAETESMYWWRLDKITS